MNRSTSLATIITTLLASFAAGCGANTSPITDGGQEASSLGDSSAEASVDANNCGMCGCDFTGRHEQRVTVEATFCSMSGGAPLPPDSGVGADDGGDAGAPSDAAAQDPATCEIDCQRACSNVNYFGRPFAAGGTCSRESATSVLCVLMFPCGRAPAGLDVERNAPLTDDLFANYLAECATIEAASVDAFERLARELRAFGAPESLARAADRSARDEAQHAAMMRALASEHGAAPHRYTVRDGGTRTLASLAHENAVEGCVRETWGALLAAWQREYAEHPAVREAMQTIAIDEQKHGALAWRVARWAEPLLDDETRASIDGAREEAFDRLIAELAAPQDPTFARAVGLPDAGTAVAMASALRASVAALARA